MSPSLRAFPILLGCLVAATAPGAVVRAAGAATSAAPIAAADTLTVYGLAESASPYPLGDAAVTVVDLDRPGAPGDLAELLADVAGLQVRRYGGVGASAAPSVRGSGAGEVRVLVDGLPLADAQHAGVDLGTLPLARFSRAEVYRGGAPARFGGAGGAGAINLVSREGAGRGSLVVGTGSFGEASARWEGGRADRGGALTTGLLLYARRADQRYGYRDRNQTFANPDDDFDAVRRNAGFREEGVSLSGAWRGGALMSRWRLDADRRDGGRPGPVGGHESPHAKLSRSGGGLRWTLGDRAERLVADVAVSRLDERLRDDLAEVGWDPPGTTTSRSDQLYGRLAWRTGATPTPGLDLRWRLGVDWRRQWYDRRVPGLDDPLRTRTATTGAVSGEIRFVGARAALRPQWRWRRLVDDFPPLPALPWLPAPQLDAPHVYRRGSPALGASWEARPGSLVVEAHWADSLREPTWVELFGDRGGVDGNRGLKPERLRTRDLSVRWRPSGVVASRLSWFRTDVDDAILWQVTSQYTSRAANAGATTTEGVELEAALGRDRGPRLAGNLTVQDTRDRSGDPVYDGKDLPYLPQVESSLALGLPAGGWRADLRWRYRSATPRDRYGTPENVVPARSQWDLALSRRWRGAGPGGRDLAATLELVNLTDVDASDVAGYPLPGRSLRAVLRCP